jgi:hypothetical protein
VPRLACRLGRVGQGVVCERISIAQLSGAQR